MFTKDNDALYEAKNTFLWFLLGFQGGFLNVGGFLGVGRFVSHVTGFATLFGAEAAKENWLIAIGMLSTPGFFVSGVMMTAIFVERRKILNKEPMYSFIFLQIIFGLALTGIMGHFGFFGEFGNHLISLKNFYYIFILAYLCGMQNAVISSVSGAAIRTTHLTGPITDLGTGIVRYWTKYPHNNSRDTFATWCRFGIIVSFIIGSLLGAILFSHLQYSAFIFPVILSSFVAYRLRKH